MITLHIEQQWLIMNYNLLFMMTNQWLMILNIPWTFYIIFDAYFEVMIFIPNTIKLINFLLFFYHRHPRILNLIHPLEENADTLAYATEPIAGSLANAIGKIFLIFKIFKIVILSFWDFLTIHRYESFG